MPSRACRSRPARLPLAAPKHCKRALRKCAPKSGFVGVTPNGKAKWKGEYSFNGHRSYLGTFTTPLEAALAYCDKHFELAGPTVKINGGVFEPLSGNFEALGVDRCTDAEHFVRQNMQLSEAYVLFLGSTEAPEATMYSVPNQQVLNATAELAETLNSLDDYSDLEADTEIERALAEVDDMDSKSSFMTDLLTAGPPRPTLVVPVMLRDVAIKNKSTSIASPSSATATAAQLDGYLMCKHDVDQKTISVRDFLPAKSFLVSLAAPGDNDCGISYKSVLA